MADRLLVDQGAKVTYAWMQLRRKARFWAEQRRAKSWQNKAVSVVLIPSLSRLVLPELVETERKREYGSHMAVPVHSETAREVDATAASSGARVILPCRKWAAIKSAEETNVVLVLSSAEKRTSRSVPTNWCS